MGAVDVVVVNSNFLAEAETPVVLPVGVSSLLELTSDG